MRPKPCPLMVQLTFENPVCPVFNCWNYTKEPARPCRECRRAFRDYIRRVPCRG